MKWISICAHALIKNWSFIKTIIILLLLSRLLSFETDKIALLIELLGSFVFLFGENLAAKKFYHGIESTEEHLQ